MNKFKFLTLLLLSVCICLASCTDTKGDTAKKPDTSLGGNTGSGQGSQSAPSDDGYIFTEESELTLVMAEGALTEENFEKVYYAFSTLKMYKMSDGSTSPAKHEIVFGRSDREISKKAYRLLDLQERGGEEKTGYVIYSDGNSLAIAYEDEQFGLTISQDLAIDCFVSKYITKDTLKVSAGAAEDEIVDMVEYQRGLDEITIQAKWDNFQTRLAENCGEEQALKITEAMKNLYKVYNSDVINWIINLYDPDTGGFYYSNSARNTEGFLPDLESTTQALGFISGSGIASTTPGGYTELLPDEMKEQIVKWVKGLQDPDSGYFYHPQWGKKVIDQYPARRGRDLQWAVKILNTFDSNPTYDTPLGDRGDGITAEEYSITKLTARLLVSCGDAVSQVVAVNATDAGVPEHLLNDVNFKAYLASLNITTSSYGAGNTLESQALEIVQRDKVLAERGVDYSLVEILYDFLNENQNKTTGLWMANGATDYNAVNGLLKISSTYNKIGKEIPNALTAVKAAMLCVGSDEEPEHVCDVLNPWYALTIVLENIETYAPEGAEATANVRLEIMNDAPRLIDVTATKLALFAKDDGSFSYYQDECAPTSQGLPVAVDNTNEGDVNATLICAQSIPSHIFGLLGLGRIHYCYEAEKIEFLISLDELSTIIKDEKDDERDEAKGRNYQVHGGECYDSPTARGTRTILRTDYYVSYDVGFDYYADGRVVTQKQEFCNIQEDEEAGTTFLEYGKAAEAGHYRGLYLRQTKSTGMECMIFETEIRISVVSDEALEKILNSPMPYLCDVKIAEITSEKETEINTNECFETVGRIYITKDSNGNIAYRLGPAVPLYMYSEEILGPEIVPGKWNTISIEMYDNGIAKYFCNNRYFTEIKFTEDITGFTLADAVRFSFSPDAVNSAVHLDKTFVGKISQTYQPGNNYIDLDSYEFKPGQYYDDFGGYDYSTQPTSDSLNIFRASWYAQWGEDLYSSAMTNPRYKREIFTVRNTTDASGYLSNVAEYGKGSFPDYYNGIYLAINSDANKGNAIVFETDFRLGEISNETLSNLEADACLMDISLAKLVSVSSGDFDINETLVKIAGVYLVKNEEGRFVYYITDRREGEYSADENFGLAIPAGAWCTLTVEVYEDGTAKYYVNGVAMGDRKLDVDAQTLALADVVRLSLTEQAIRSSVLLDNTFFGKIEKEYVQSDDYIPSGEEYPEWPSENEVFPDRQTILTYEGGKIPGAISRTLASEGASLAIKDMIVNGQNSKALVLTTKPGGNDYINFRPTITAESFNAISFETDIMITNAEGVAEFGIEPITAGSARAFRLNMKAYEGKVTVYATGLPSVTVGNIGEWIHIRIDYMNPKVDYDGDGKNDILYKIYIGGAEEPVAVCYTPYNANIYEPSEIATVRFFMYSSTDADICFDNTSFTQLTLEPDKLPEPELPPAPPAEPEVSEPDDYGPGHTEGETTHDPEAWN